MSKSLGFQPLYQQVYNMLVRRIAEGVWRPAESLPSEQTLAEELGVSQGTVRKALDVMAAEKLVERRQGKGTYVTEHTQERSLFRFFRLAKPGGQRVTPLSKVESIKRRLPRRIEKTKLNLHKRAEVVEIRRTRFVDELAILSENIILPVDFFPGIDKMKELPNTLYSLYQSEYGVSVVVAHEEISAMLASKEDAKRLNVSVGLPLINIDRVAVAINGKQVEWRVSRCDTSNVVYGVALN